jgi:hypothetical protein
MRTFMVLPMAGILALALAAPVAAGPNVSNTSGGGNFAYGEWYGDGVYGSVVVGQEKGQPGWGDFYEERGQWVPCGPGEESYGFQGTRTYGWAYDVQVDFSRRLEQGSASGLAELYTETIDECAGTWLSSGSSEQAFVMTLTGVGDLVSFKGHGSYQVPSEFNGHSNYRGKERAAGGSLNVGRGVLDVSFDWAYMSQYSWTDHSNS